MSGILVLPPNQPTERFYRGGPRIAAFRGTDSVRDDVPEDWIASTTPLFGEERLGLTALADGTLLRDAIRTDPVRWLGAEHVRAFGADTGLLVKLLDAGQRLPVHVHPSREDGRRLLGMAHGKTEAWLVLEGGEVHLGFAEPVERAVLDDWVARQDVDAMLAAMHRIRVEPGRSVLVPAGMPHAIGRGVFVVELQEPADASVMLEWRDFAIDGPGAGQLGLGLERSLTTVDRRGWSAESIAALVTVPTRDRPVALPVDADPFFRAEWFTDADGVELDAGFAVLIVTAGQGIVRSADESLPVARGTVLLVPHEAGPVRLEGPLSVVRARPPAPETSPAAPSLERSETTP